MAREIQSLDDIYDLTDAELLDVIENASTNDAYGIMESLTLLCDRYDIPMRDKMNEWRSSEELITALKRVIHFMA